jgi:hypothetical protein
MTPSAAVPPSYVAGAITVPAGVVSNLLSLIQAQIAPNCPGTATEFLIAADAGNAGAVSVGAASLVSGALSSTNYAYRLTPASPPRVYRSTYPGSNTLIGEMQVLSAAAAVLHVEVCS